MREFFFCTLKVNTDRISDCEFRQKKLRENWNMHIFVRHLITLIVQFRKCSFFKVQYFDMKQILNNIDNIEYIKDILILIKERKAFHYHQLKLFNFSYNVNSLKRLSFRSLYRLFNYALMTWPSEKYQMRMISKLCWTSVKHKCQLYLLLKSLKLCNNSVYDT